MKKSLLCAVCCCFSVRELSACPRCVRLMLTFSQGHYGHHVLDRLVSLLCQGAPLYIYRAVTVLV
jgi:hypothetical protein